MQTTVPGQIASEIHEHRSRRHLMGHLKSAQALGQLPPIMPMFVLLLLLHDIGPVPPSDDSVTHLSQWRAGSGTHVHLPRIRQLQRAEASRSKRQRSPSSPSLWCARTCATLSTLQKVCLLHRRVLMPFAGLWYDYALRGVRQVHCCIWRMKLTVVQCHRRPRGPAEGEFKAWEAGAAQGTADCVTTIARQM